MKYNGFYYALFRGTMKKVLTEHYGESFAADTMHCAKGIYKKLVLEADDIGSDNPMAYNVLFALAFIAPYLASEKQIAPDVVKEMMERSLYHVRWYFSRTDLNTRCGKAQHKKAIMAYCKWYTPERERAYPSSFKVDFEGQPYDGACYYRITRCPICAYAQRLDVMEIMPLLCSLDEVMIRLEHGVLQREQMIATGGAYCDYFVVGDKEGLV